MAARAFDTTASHSIMAVDPIAAYLSLDDLTSKASGRWEAVRGLDVISIGDAGDLSRDLRQIADRVEALRPFTGAIESTLRDAGVENPETEIMVKIASAMTLREDFLTNPTIQDTIRRQIEIIQSVFRNVLSARTMTNELRAFAVESDLESRRPFSLNLATLIMYKGLLVKALDLLKTANLTIDNPTINEMIADMESTLATEIEPFIAECKADPLLFRSTGASPESRASTGRGGGQASARTDGSA